MHPAWERVATSLNHLRDAIAYTLIGLGVFIVSVGSAFGLVSVVSIVIGVILFLIALVKWLVGFFGLAATPRQSTARAYIVWSTSLFGASFILSLVAGASAAAAPPPSIVPYALGAPRRSALA